MTLKPVCKVAHVQILKGNCPWCGSQLGDRDGAVVWNTDAMTTGLSDPDLEVRRLTLANIECHGGLEPESAMRLLSRTISQSDDEIRDQAERALEHLGRDLTADAAKRLESMSVESGHELAKRILLLGYYFLGQRESLDAMRARQSHVLWLIEHAPRSKTAGTPEASLERDEDDDSYERARRLWLQHIETNPHDTAILGNAAHFFIHRDIALSEELLKTARSLDPRNPWWSDRLGRLYSLRAGGEDADLRENSAAALRELKAAEDVKLGIPWHAQEPDAAKQNAEDAVMTLLTRMHTLPSLAKTACDAGEFNEAQRYAHELLELTRSNRLPEFFRNEGNAIHDGNLVLGRCALNQGKVEEAKKCLRAAGQTTGSPQLGSFGPNMTLAKALLERGEVEAVVEYFELCRRFWKMGGSQLDEWTAEARRGDVPEFGANLRY